MVPISTYVPKACPPRLSAALPLCVPSLCQSTDWQLDLPRCLPDLVCVCPCELRSLPMLTTRSNPCSPCQMLWLQTSSPPLPPPAHCLAWLQALPQPAARPQSTPFSTRTHRPRARASPVHSPLHAGAALPWNPPMAPLALSRSTTPPGAWLAARQFPCRVRATVAGPGPTSSSSSGSSRSWGRGASW